MAAVILEDPTVKGCSYSLLSFLVRTEHFVMIWEKSTLFILVLRQKLVRQTLFKIEK